MDREYAMTIVLAEAFSETGLAALAENGADPGSERIDHLIEALAFLMDELADEDAFSRELVSALFVLGSRVPDLILRRDPEEANSRPSLYEQAEALAIAVTALIENWNHWPDWETYEFRTYPSETSSKKSQKAAYAEQVGGYRSGDITYCVDPSTRDCFPVRVDRLGGGFLEVSPLTEGDSAFPDFRNEAANRRFFYPNLSPGARFGGEDERLVNSKRRSGPELRLLPTHYATKTLELIRERHAANPEQWPIPTGVIFERWFQDMTAHDEGDQQRR